MGIIRHAGIGLIALAALGAGGEARADDVAQICMFRCAPQLGEAGYDQCVSDCFAEESGEPAAGGVADLTPIHGSWRGDLAQCGKVTDDGWEIDASGASAFELTCEMLSSSRDGDLFVLNQRCEYYEEVEDETMTFRLVSADEIEAYDMRFRRCPG